MSTFIFGSNQISLRRKNATNNFDIDLSPPIDARNINKYIKVDEIIYPDSLSTIHPRNREKFQMKIEMEIYDYLQQTDRTNLKGSVKFTHETTYLPDGHHSINELICILNKTLNKFNVNINKTVGNKSRFLFSKRWIYNSTFENTGGNTWLKERSFRNANKKDNFKIKLLISFGNLLSHTLGLDKDEIKFENKTNTESSDIMTFVSPYVIDPLFGLNFIVINCDKIEAVQLGYVYKPILSIIPIKLNTNFENKSEVLRFSPNSNRRKLINGIIENIHFRVSDLNDNELFFNSGKFIINCTIE